MFATNLRLNGLRGFEDSGDLSLSEGINLFVGANNSGKSTILKALYLLQNQCLSHKDIRIGKDEAKIAITFDNLKENKHFTKIASDAPSIETWGNIITIQLRNPTNTPEIVRKLKVKNAAKTLSLDVFTDRKPDNLFYPFLSKRKVYGIDENITEDRTKRVHDNFQNLNAKIDEISNPNSPAYPEYSKACSDILGFTVSCFSSANGKKGGLMVNWTDNISLEAMGEGVTNIAGLITDLFYANKGNIFLIEEMENDIHPAALKKLLELIIQKSEKHQFFISTHSNIVTKYLGSLPDSKVFHVQMELQDKLPTSTITELSNTPEDRIRVLEELGYELYDFDLYKAYLILEESSAERIIKDFLIPEFVPSLKYELRTIAAQGITDVEPKVQDFMRLFVFIHTADLYKNKAWVAVDNGEEGQKVIRSLKEKFNKEKNGWNEEHFLCFEKNDFERYYPAIFQNEANSALKISDKKKKQTAKEVLLKKVITWIDEDKKRAKKEFQESAKEVIHILKTIEAKLNEKN